MQRLIAYDYPGNIRELENLVRRLIVLRDPRYILGELQTRNAADPQPAMAPAQPQPGAAQPAPSPSEHGYQNPSYHRAAAMSPPQSWPAMAPTRDDLTPHDCRRCADDLRLSAAAVERRRSSRASCTSR